MFITKPNVGKVLRTVALASQLTLFLDNNDVNRIS